MTDKNLLAIFEVVMEEKKERFAIYGEYELTDEWDHYNNPYKYPDFYDLSAYHIVRGKEIPYQPKGHTWTGRRYCEEDMIRGFVSNQILPVEPYYTKIFLEEGLQKLVDSYIREENIVMKDGNFFIPKLILGNTMWQYELMLITNNYFYYAYYDETLMYDVKEKSLVSDNYFASVGYWDSIENISSGKEELVWGEMPEDFNS